jgi:virginiamycin B lyase
LDVELSRFSRLAFVALIVEGLVAGPLAGSGTRHQVVGAARSQATISVPTCITTGPDGALWFTDQGTAGNPGSIGRITVAGKVTIYSGRGIDEPLGITAGPDGAIWYTNDGNNSIGRITTGGKISSYTASGVTDPAGIATGRNGDLWFTNSYDPGSVGIINTSGKITIYSGLSSDIKNPFGITPGPDGAMWVAAFGAGVFNAFGGLNGGTKGSKGSITQFGADGNFTVYTQLHIEQPFWITLGPDKALWFTDDGANAIGQLTTSGSFKDWSNSADIDEPRFITAGPDGALWFTNGGNNTIGRITTKGVVQRFANKAFNNPLGITAGPDGALWFTNAGNNTIGRITTDGRVTTFS